LRREQDRTRGRKGSSLLERRDTPKTRGVSIEKSGKVFRSKEKRKGQEGSSEIRWKKTTDAELTVESTKEHGGYTAGRKKDSPAAPTDWKGKGRND